MNSNEQKALQLGMPFGTACNRLRKNILFKLLVDFKLNVCFHCNRDITNVDELSIEHKQPWFKTNADLFWDLDNIAFSHYSCNSGAANHDNQRILKTHCINGHEYTEANTSRVLIRGKVTRRCKKCLSNR